MKKRALLSIIPALVLSLTGCDFNKGSEEFLYNEVVYEPLEIENPNPELYVLRLDLLGVYNGVMAAEWDSYDIKLRAIYSDYSIKDFPFKVKNIPIEMRHYLGEVGEQHLYMMEYKWTSALDFTIIENPNWDGYKCEFYDSEKRLLTTKKVGYYEEVVYDGPDIPMKKEDYDYKYRFVGWNYPTRYVHQDMKFVTKYEKLEKRYYATKPYNNDHIGLAAILDKSRNEGSGLVYLGRVRHVAVVYTEAQELDQEDLEFRFNVDDFGKFYNEYNENIVKYSIKYVENAEYEQNILRHPYEIFNTPNFASEFDARYGYKGVKAYLQDGTDTTLSALNPFEWVAKEIPHYANQFNVGKVSKDEEAGFYRYSVVMSFDVYLSVSFNKIDKDVYDVAAFNKFIISPVRDTTKVIIQHSKDGDFSGDVEDKLVLTTKTLYYTAKMIDWGD